MFLADAPAGALENPCQFELVPLGVGVLGGGAEGRTVAGGSACRVAGDGPDEGCAPPGAVAREPLPNRCHPGVEGAGFGPG